MKTALVRCRGGFTIVELIIVIFVIAILAAISLVAYVGIQKRAAESVVVGSLRNVTQKSLTMQVKTNTIPTSVIDNANESKDIQMSIVTSGGGAYYSGLSEHQKALLLINVCQQLVDEGYGKGLDSWGVSQVFVSKCEHDTGTSISIKGWGAQNMGAPITEARMRVFESMHSDSGFKSTTNTFFNELVIRYSELGGSFPITSVWKPWVPGEVPTLPTPETLTSTGFCIVARHVSRSDIVFYTTSTSTTPKPGDSCT